MSGHIRQRGPGWEVRLSVGTDPVTGRRRQRTCTVRGTREMAEDVLAGWIRELPPPLPKPMREPRRQWWPWEPLEGLVAGLGLSKMALARLAGVHPRQVYRWPQHGLLDEAADNLATRLGLHPANIWPDW